MEQHDIGTNLIQESSVVTYDNNGMYAYMCASNQSTWYCL